MKARRATLQQLQVLQSARPLEVPPACLGATDPSLADLRPKELFADSASADHNQLREIVCKAEFWISLLEGEHSDLSEEISKHKKRYQLALRQADVKATELKEVESEKKRLLADIKWMRESRDQAICDRALLRDNASRMTTETKDNFESAATRAQTLEAELERSRGEKKLLEEQLVVVKVRAVDTMQKVDSMECLIEYYEDRLRALDPRFEPVDIASVGQWMKPSRQDCDADSNGSGTNEQESVISQEKPRAQQIAKGFSKMWKSAGKSFKSSKKKGSKHDDAQEHDDFQTTPREFDDCGRQLARPSTTPSPQPTSSPRETRQRSQSRRRSGLQTPEPSPRPQEDRHFCVGGVAELASVTAPRTAVAAAAIRGAVNDTASPMPSSEPEQSPGADGGGVSQHASPAKPKKRWEMRRED